MRTNSVRVSSALCMSGLLKGACLSGSSALRVGAISSWSSSGSSSWGEETSRFFSSFSAPRVEMLPLEEEQKPVAGNLLSLFTMQLSYIFLVQLLHRRDTANTSTTFLTFLPSSSKEKIRITLGKHSRTSCSPLVAFPMLLLPRTLSGTF